MHYNKMRLQYSMQNGYYILQHHIININMQQHATHFSTTTTQTYV